MAEWLYEAGIGENRAALVADGRILKARIERHDRGPRVGTIASARVLEVSGREARVRLADGGEALLSPPAAAEGRTLLVEVTREVIPEPGRAKLPRVAPALEGAVPGDGPDLLARISATEYPVRRLHPHEPDALEQAGWSEVVEEAQDGEIAFAGGALRMSPTPAMTLFDVDGSGPLEPLTIAAATAVAKAIVRHGIGGSIGIDFPTLGGKAARLAVAEAIDAALPQPFERTAVNGFGFLQIVRRRSRASLPELVRADATITATMAVLRSVERIPPGSRPRLVIPPAVRRCLDAHPDWTADLIRRTGVAPHFETR